ncbi:MAG: V4R domain-containing protein [Thermoproteota archaeon]
MQLKGRTSMEKLIVDEVSKVNIPKDFLCEVYSPTSRLVEFYVKVKNIHLDKVANTLLKYKAAELCGFQYLDPEKGEIVKGFVADLSNSDMSLADIVKAIEGTEGVLEVRFSNSVLNGLIIDELFFPLTIGGERSFTLRVDSFGAILKRLYEKFGTGAAVILYEMGLGMGENKFKGIMDKYQVDKQTAVRIILAERAAKGWCIVKIEELNGRSAVVVAHELFECIPFKNNQGKSASQLFRGYLAGIFQQLYGKSVIVAETECIAKGDDVCRFIIQAAK